MFCEYSFWLRYIQKEKEKLGLKPLIGTNIHMVFPEFFNRFDSDVGFRNVDQNIPVARHPFRRYVYDTCMEIIPAKDREFKVYKGLIRNFATVETVYWLNLNSNPYINDSEIIKYFLPNQSEQFLDDNKLKIYGTLDQILDMPDNQGVPFRYIFDYKTGNVPKDVRKLKKKANDPFSWTLPSGFMMETHFYALLHYLNQGCTLSQDIIDFCTKDEFLTVADDPEDWKALKKKKRKYLSSIDCKLRYPDGTEVQNKEMGVGIFFLGDPLTPYIPIKQFTYRSLKAVFSWINVLRSIWGNEKFVTFPPYNEYKCPHCSREEECKAKYQELVDRMSK